MKIVVLLTLALFLIATTSRAQDQSAPPQDPPERNLATSATSALSALGHGNWDLSVSGFGGYNHTLTTDPVVPAGGDATTSPLPPSGLATGASVSGGVSSGGRRSSFSLHGGVNTFYVYDKSNVNSDVMFDVNATASQSTTFGRHTTFSVGEFFGYQPYYSFGLFPSIGTFGSTGMSTPYQPTNEQGIRTANVYRVGAATRLSHPFTDRTSFYAGYSVSWYDVGQSANTTSHDISAGISHSITQTIGYHVGYGYMLSIYQLTGTPTGIHNIDVGIDYHKSLSLTRRTTFSFSTGSGVYKSADSTTDLTTSSKFNFRITGSANLNQYLARTWSARVAYNRDWQVVPGATQPYFSDGLTGGIGGSVGRRGSAGVNASYLLGSGQQATTTASDHALTTTAFINYSLLRRLSSFVQYTYYRHNFDNLLADLTLPHESGRHSVYLGLTLNLAPGR